MLYDLFLVLVLVVSDSAKSHRVQFRLAEGIEVCLVPESERQLIHPLMLMYQSGTFISTAHSQRCLRLPIPKDVLVGIFAGDTGGHPSELDIVIKDEDNIRIRDIIKGLWVLKQYAQSDIVRALVGPPNAVIYLRSSKLDRLRSALKPE